MNIIKQYEIFVLFTQIFDFLCKYKSNYTFFIVRFGLLFGLLFDLDRIVCQKLPTDNEYSYSILFVCIGFYEYTNMNTTIHIRICIHKTNSKSLFNLGANRIVKSTIPPSLIAALVIQRFFLFYCFLRTTIRLFCSLCKVRRPVTGCINHDTVVGLCSSYL